MQLTEFVEVIKIYRMIPHNHTKWHTEGEYFLFQFLMMARLEDLGNFKCESIMLNLKHAYTLKSKICWCKNGIKKCKSSDQISPDQIIIGQMDSNFYRLLGLALNLEHADLAINQDNNPLLFCVQKWHI